MNSLFTIYPHSRQKWVMRSILYSRCDHLLQLSSATCFSFQNVILNYCCFEMLYDNAYCVQIRREVGVDCSQEYFTRYKRKWKKNEIGKGRWSLRKQGASHTYHKHWSDYPSTNTRLWGNMGRCEVSRWQVKNVTKCLKISTFWNLLTTFEITMEIASRYVQT